MSTLRTNTISNAAGSASVPVDTVVSGTAKAWVNFNGTGTVAIRQAFNCSSIVDNGTGDYTMQFSTAMVDSGYATSCLSGKSVTADILSLNSPNTENVASTGVRVMFTYHPTGAVYDSPVVCLSIFR